jgi:hypothetical protein
MSLIHRMPTVLPLAIATALTATAFVSAPAYADEWGDCKPTADGYTCQTLREASIATCLGAGGDLPRATLDGIKRGDTYNCIGGRHNGVRLDPDEMLTYAQNPDSMLRWMQNFEGGFM